MVLASIWRLHANLIVGVAFFQRAEMFKHVHYDRKGFGRYRDVRRPATELLVRGDAIGQHVFVDIGEVELFGFGDLSSRRLIDVNAGLPIGSHEGFGHI